MSFFFLDVTLIVGGEPLKECCWSIFLKLQKSLVLMSVTTSSVAKSLLSMQVFCFVNK